MNKYIKYTSIIFVGFLLIFPIAYAEVGVPPKKPEQNARQEFKDLRKNENTEVKNNKEALKNDLNKDKIEFKNEIQGIKENISNTNPADIDALKNELESKKEEIKQVMKTKYDDFLKQIETKRGEAQIKIETSKIKLNTDILKIKDEKKKETVLNITNKITELNTKAINNLTININKIDEVLTRVKAKVAEEKMNGTDVKISETSISLSDKIIADARAAIIIQTTKQYTTTITTDTALKGTMGKIKDTFNTDISTLREKVKLAHTSVKNIVETLPKPEAPQLIEGSNNNVTNVESETTN